MGLKCKPSYTSPHKLDIVPQQKRDDNKNKKMEVKKYE